MNDERPDDYIDVIEMNNTKNWIDHYKKYIKIKIDNKELPWLKEACKIGMVTGTFSEIFREQLDSLLEENKEAISKIFNGKKYFVRTENVSLKFGQHGVGPYYGFKEIIESSVSSLRGHSPINFHTNELTFYLIDWIDIDDNLEFRMFIYNKNVTCISQQKCYKQNTLLKYFDNEAIKDIVKLLLNYFETDIKNVIEQDSYSIDIALVNNIPYFIEVNCFGKEYAAGSALFHWIIDYDLLYSDAKKVYFRYTY